MQTLGSKIRHLREKKNMTQTELSQILGMKTYTTVSKWENNENFPKGKDLKELAELFEVSADYLLGLSKENISSIETIYNKLETQRQTKVYDFAKEQLEKQIEENNKVIPLVGKTAANPAVLEYADIDIEQHSFAHVPEGADCAINIQGDSMEPLIKNGSIVFYKRQCDVENGEIAIVEINGEGVTCKKVIKDYNSQAIILRSINAKYDDKKLCGEEIRIIGKVMI